MKIFITGGTGFVGSSLSKRLIREGHELSVLTRGNRREKNEKPGLSYVSGDPALPGLWQQNVKEHDVIINLAGASIFSRWTRERKRQIRESRIKSTKNIIDALDSSSGKAVTLVNASAAGYYGFHEDEELRETDSPGRDFLADVAREWEEEAFKAQDKGARVCIARFGIVLGAEGGALGIVMPLFRNFLGGPVGNGKQWFSWVHIDDLTGAISFLLRHRELSGPFNLCSPNPVRNREFSKAVARALHRPSWLPAPGFMVRLVLGEFGSVILKGQRVIPQRLLQSGFRFEYEDIEKAVRVIKI